MLFLTEDYLLQKIMKFPKNFIQTCHCFLEGSPASEESYVLHAKWFLYYLCSTIIGMTLVSPFTLYLPSTNGSCIIGIVGLYKASNVFSEFNTLSYADVYVLMYFLWHVNSDNFELLFGLTIYPTLGITCTGSLSYGSDVTVKTSDRKSSP